MQQLKRSRIPLWLAVVLWPAQLLFLYVAVPAGLAEQGPRLGWRHGRSGVWNLLGMILVVPGLLALGWIAYRHVARFQDRIVLPPAPQPFLLTDGMYARSRNPWYVTGIATWVGWTVYYGSLPVMAGAAAFWAGVTFLAVPYEERTLEARFGEIYRRYRDAVPRWLWLPRSRAGMTKVR